MEHGSFWFRARSRLIAWALQRYFPRARSLLEIGCGTGFVLESVHRAVPQLWLVGADLHSQGLKHASARLPELDFLQLDARRIPYEREFDVIGAFDVLEHIAEDRRVLQEMHAAVKPGGGILLTVPQHPWLWSAIDEYGEHKRRYRRTDLIAKISAAGFEIQRITSFVTLLLPAMAAMRLRARLRHAPLDPTRELAISRRLTAALERVMDVERSIVVRGADLPAGGSLLVVANRAGG
ncbi:MAG TPA: class I SAM-dependent methyltransferase [Solirubrobacteraceae bacterium]|nr:class I SAM-dependent methyltransferase [Solirubrobacteraceae bacterium]